MCIRDRNYTADNGTVSFQTTFTNASIGMLILYTLADVPNPTLFLEQYDMESGEYVEPSETAGREGYYEFRATLGDLADQEYTVSMNYRIWDEALYTIEMQTFTETVDADLAEWETILGIYIDRFACYVDINATVEDRNGDIVNVSLVWMDAVSYTHLTLPTT